MIKKKKKITQSWIVMYAFYRIQVPVGLQVFFSVCKVPNSNLVSEIKSATLAIVNENYGLCEKA